MAKTKKIERITKGKPDDVDKHVGARLRVRRTYLGYSQEKLADSCGITFQQIQKYERGTNRVSAGRLYQFSILLDVPVGYFFDGMNTVAGKLIPEDDQFLGKDNLTLMSLINQLPTEQKKSFIHLVRGMIKHEVEHEAA